MPNDLYTAMYADTSRLQQICGELLEYGFFREHLARGGDCFFDALEIWKPLDPEEDGYGCDTPEDAYHLMTDIWALCALRHGDVELTQALLNTSVNGL